MRKGVTLIELVIMMVLIGALSVGISRYLVNVIDVWNFTSFRSDIVANARGAFMKMIRDIRQIKKRTPSENTIEVADRSALQFISLDTNYNDIRIRYRLSGNYIYYDLDSNFDGTFDNSQILMTGAYNFYFKYYTKAGDELNPYPLSSSDREKIYQIGIEFEVREKDQSYQFRTKVFPRNLK